MSKKFWTYTAALILTTVLIAACGAAPEAVVVPDAGEELGQCRCEPEELAAEELNDDALAPTAEPTEAPVEPEAEGSNDAEVEEAPDTEPTPEISQEQLAYRVRCETPECQSIVATYGLEGIYGYAKDSYVMKLQASLDAYADMLGQGNRALGQTLFNERISGENGLQRIEFVEEMQSGRRGKPYARFAPDAMPELGELDPDVYAIWCPENQMLGLCSGFGVAPGTILVDVSTQQHLDELERTIAHEVTHALDSKSGESARALYDASGAYALSPEVGGSLQEQFAELVALWLFPRTGDPAQDWNPAVGSFIVNYMGPDYVAMQDAGLAGTN